MSSELKSAGTRWLGVGLAAIIAVVTIALTVTGRLQLYINPAQAWFACAMAVILLVGAAASFALPLGAEDDHGHDHGDDHGHARGHARPWGPRRVLAAVATGSGAVIASAFAVASLVLPPATLSADIAMERDTGSAPLFAGADDVQLGVVDTSAFGVGDWSAVFATATNPERYEGESVVLTGFVTPGDDGGIELSRLVITHCVIDAQPAALPVASDDAAGLDTGQWIELRGDVTVGSGGGLVIEATSIEPIDEPEEPYEY